MTVSGNSEESAARATIEQAGASLARRRSEIPANFIKQLYGRAVPEDVIRYAPDDLATLAAGAYDFIAERQSGMPKIRCETTRLAQSGDRNSVTIVEIVNDDMPFLVDSVMGEIAERKLDVELVVHPMFGVRRTGSKLGAIGTPDSAGTRESFIHIHLSPIAEDSCRELTRALEGVLGEVRLAVQDWRPMRERVTGIVAELTIDGNDLPLVRVGDRVLLQFEGWAAVQFAAYPEAAAGTHDADYLFDRFRELIEGVPARA